MFNLFIIYLFSAVALNANAGSIIVSVQDLENSFQKQIFFDENASFVEPMFLTFDESQKKVMISIVLSKSINNHIKAEGLMRLEESIEPLIKEFYEQGFYVSLKPNVPVMIANYENFFFDENNTKALKKKISATIQLNLEN